jgi:hypothetical protein
MKWPMTFCKPGKMYVDKCEQCGEEDIPLVEFGPDYDYEQSPVKICKECLQKALDILKNNDSGG